METTRPRATEHTGGNITIDLPIGEIVGANFDLGNAVCSHGLFMMAPNKWDPHSKTLARPLRLNSDGDYDSPSVNVQISHPEDTPSALRLRVFDVEFLSNNQKQSLMDQVRRMLRLSKEEEQNVREFQEMYIEAKKKGFGRLFRSPTLFEDMVKCILLCNCQWSRTLSMARALCELQMELKSPLLGSPVCEANNCSASRNRVADIDQFLPKTPVGKEVKRRNGTRKDSSLSAISNAEVEKDVSVNIDCAEISGFHRLDKQGTSFHMRTDKNIYMPFDDSSTLAESAGVNLNLISDANSSEIAHDYSSNYIGNFPSPAELVSIDENILANRCKLGYRAKRIISLARTIVEGRIQPKQLEQACSRPSVSIYNKLADQLKEIEGFGPYTCANVLMCMGFYHVIPSDSETIRHIKQVHKRNSDIRTIGQDVEVIYGKFAPFQYLVYWSEVWSFYEERFGRLRQMIYSDYKLITATNLIPKTPAKQKKNKRIKLT
ncbi:hypothetical protein DCAR_0933933 [Daucus carota subsp. sativus]|uniref:Uncharacterized protein n=1 Tax=Daucus carota subsp. sativus TaxID=79200 RepID=A0A175YEL6_DAUCS|nr:PREDICTED: uncharacterized protein LOC108200662 [Daucus carota subsp. sativus]WOH14414.1 hypothetical protein DCAR_0933933 [Daucus carota subsp. sativus]